MDNINNSIVAIATTSNKTENQDAVRQFRTEKLNAIFIADGLGSFRYAKTAAENIVDFFCEKCEGFDLTSEYITKIYSEAQNLLCELRKNLIEIVEPTDLLFGTSAISVFELEDKFIIAYTGNGAIWHIRGNFNEFPNYYHFPWNAVNILNPHTIPQDGKEVLYKLISDQKNIIECTPSIITVEKDKIYGDIIMICTDGISSADQLRVGKNDKGVWVKYEQNMLNFFNKLKFEFTEEVIDNNERLSSTLNSYLEHQKPLLEDDATVGVIITSSTIKYQMSKQK